MSQHLFDQLTYSEDDWHIMENAHIRACELLGEHPAHYEHNDRLARTIMQVFGTGARDYEIIASIAAQRKESWFTYYLRVIEIPDTTCCARLREKGFAHLEPQG